MSFLMMLFNTAKAFVIWLWSDVLRYVGVQLVTWGQDALRFLMDWAFDQLPGGWAVWMTRSPFPTMIYDLAEDVNYFIPWKAAVGIWVFATTIIGAIRLVRWCLGWSMFGVSPGA